jgi:hypothetical protein
VETTASTPLVAPQAQDRSPPTTSTVLNPPFQPSTHATMYAPVTPRSVPHMQKPQTNSHLRTSVQVAPSPTQPQATPTTTHPRPKPTASRSAPGARNGTPTCRAATRLLKPRRTRQSPPPKRTLTASTKATTARSTVKKPRSKKRPRTSWPSARIRLVAARAGSVLPSWWISAERVRSVVVRAAVRSE